MDPIVLSSIPLSDIVVGITKALREELAAQTPPGQPPAEELLTRKEVAQLLGITLPTLREWTKRGDVPGYYIGSRIRYKRSEVINSLAQIKTRRPERP
jgi:excisionase family DNA binding protein